MGLWACSATGGRLAVALTAPQQLSGHGCPRFGPWNVDQVEPDAAGRDAKDATGGVRGPVSDSDSSGASVTPSTCDALRKYVE
jgi:hypothetical protein